MARRALGIAVLLGVLSLAGGYGLAQLTRDAPALAGVAAPVPATSPSVPAPVLAPYAEDVDLPPLETNLTYDQRQLGAGPFAWVYAGPLSWPSVVVGIGEATLAPPGNPAGGYGMRVKLVNANLTPAQMVEQKLAALQSGYEDVSVVGRSEDTLAVTFRSLPENWLRYNTFRWFTPDDSDLAAFETSVNGRERDQRGLRDLLDQISASAQRVPTS